MLDGSKPIAILANSIAFSTLSVLSNEEIQVLAEMMANTEEN